MSAACLIANFASTWAMVGLIWFVQVVHYPLFARVGREAFVAYEQLHTRLTGIVVMPLMLTELATAGLLLFWRPSGIPSFQMVLGLALVVVIWLVTFTIQVPQHAVLCERFDAQTAAALVRGNWLRTVLWSLRGGLVAWWVVRLLPPVVSP